MKNKHLCSDELPEKSGWYKTNLGSLHYAATTKIWINGYLNHVYPEYWFDKLYT